MSKMCKNLLFGATAMLGCSQAMAISVTGTDDGSVLVNEILGGGISVSNITYSDGTNYTQSGTFTGGLSSGLSMDKGIILTTGEATDAEGPNSSSGLTKNTDAPGDASLNALVTPYSTQDAAVLEFDFSSVGGDLFFSFQFASEEYNEYTNSVFNDVFAFFVDGVNIALIPGTTDPVTINNVNGGNPLGTNATNPDLYNNNDTGAFDLEYDGFTDLFVAQALGLSVGDHHFKLAIADTSDGNLDSAVFLKAGSFSDKPPVETPEPGILALLGLGLAGMTAVRRRKQV
jgi:hypothetical protein